MLRVNPRMLFVPDLGQIDMYVTYAIQSSVSTTLCVLIIHDVDTICDSLRTVVCDWLRLHYADVCASKDTHLYVTGVFDNLPFLSNYQVYHL